MATLSWEPSKYFHLDEFILALELLYDMTYFKTDFKRTFKDDVQTLEAGRADKNQTNEMNILKRQTYLTGEKDLCLFSFRN